MRWCLCVVGYGRLVCVFHCPHTAFHTRPLYRPLHTRTWSTTATTSPCPSSRLRPITTILSTKGRNSNLLVTRRTALFARGPCGSRSVRSKTWRPTCVGFGFGVGVLVWCVGMRGKGGGLWMERMEGGKGSGTEQALPSLPPIPFSCSPSHPSLLIRQDLAGQPIDPIDPSRRIVRPTDRPTEQACTYLCVECGEGVVEEVNVRVGVHGPRQRQPLLLACGFVSE
jgi:hypothetical protein